MVRAHVFLRIPYLCRRKIGPYRTSRAFIVVKRGNRSQIIFSNNRVLKEVSVPTGPVPRLDIYKRENRSQIIFFQKISAIDRLPKDGSVPTGPVQLFCSKMRESVTLVAFYFVPWTHKKLTPLTATRLY